MRGNKGGNLGTSRNPGVPRPRTIPAGPHADPKQRGSVARQRWKRRKSAGRHR